MESPPSGSCQPDDAASLTPSVRGLRTSATLAINERCRRLREQGAEICHLGFGQSPFPVPESVVAALRQHAHHKDYLPVAGLESLRQAVAQFHAGRLAMPLDADDVIIGPGSKELMFLLQVARGGELIVPTPCWVSYGPQATILGRHLGRIPASYETGWRITAEALDHYCRAQTGPRGRPLLILNSPANPTGNSYSEEELQQLATVARNWGVIVVSDEIYAELSYDAPPASLRRYYPEGTIVSSGLSKWCGAGGWRLGAMLFPPELAWLRRAVCAVASETYTTVSAPIQYAAVTAFECGPEIEDYLRHCRRILQRVGDWMCRSLLELDLQVHPPTGGFYLYPDFTAHQKRLARRGVEGSVAMCQHLLTEAGVALLPAADFERPPHELAARCAFVDFDGQQALASSRDQGLDQPLPASFVDQHCPSMVHGVQRLRACLAS